ncbi:MAG: alpha/beta hydrolase [Bdellovibrionales bacterium]|nr:alpha/beta hydrolase [Bdellovibrionales bacterium]
MIFIAASVVLAWFLSSPISVFTTIENTKLAMNSVDKKNNNGLESFEYDGCEEANDCECVALIHGMGDSAYTWTKTLTASDKTWDKPVYFYAVNLPGSNESKALEDVNNYRVSAMADLISNNLPSRCDKWTVVGNSFGGWLSIKLAAQHPEKVKGLLLMGSAGINADYSKVAALFEDPSEENLKAFQKLAYAKPKSIPSFVYSSLSKRLKSMPVKEMIHAQTKDDFIDEDFKNLKMPTYLVWGDKDQVCPLDFATKMKELNPNANLEILKDCGHLPQKECFKDFAKNLNSLLKVEGEQVESQVNVQ